MNRAGGAVLLALALASAVPVDGAVLCRKRNGTAFLRDACKRREKPVESPKGTAGDAGPAAARAPRVVDAAGAPVGTFAEPVSSEGGSTVLVPAAGRLVVVSIDRLNDRGFFFASADCSGPRLLLEQPRPFVRQAIFFRGTLYYAEDPVVRTTTKSRLSVATSTDCTPSGGTVLPDGLCCFAGDFTSDFGAATVAFDAAALGTPPFRLEF